MESRSEGIGGQFSKHLPVHRHRQEPHDNCQRGSDAFEGKKNDRASMYCRFATGVKWLMVRRCSPRTAWRDVVVSFPLHLCVT